MNIRSAKSSLILLLLLAITAFVQIAHGDSRDQMEFGVEAAKKGLWREAEFRWEKARKLSPNNAHILNNLAVAQETQGNFEEADRLYQEALRLLPGNEDIKENYRHFTGFYDQYRSRRKDSRSETDTPPPPPDTNPEDS